MNFEETYLKLEPSIRAQALMGKYMGHFSAMENKINETIEISLELDITQSLIICSNLPFSNKVQILRALNDSYVESKDVKNSNNKNLLKILKFSEDRNLAAHTVFLAEEDKTNGIVFYKSRATGKLVFQDVTWSIEDVKNKCSELLKAARFLEKLASYLLASTIDTRKAVQSIHEAASIQSTP